jgi:DNA polymerase III subunit epsilon
MEINIPLSRPIVFFDTETTGVDRVKDRIVELSMTKLHPDGGKEIKTYRFNPTIPIPIEASKVHNIFDEDVEDEATFTEKAGEVAGFFLNCDIAGFNIIEFDLPLIVEEFLRANVEVPFNVSTKIIDSLKIFYEFEKRDLSAAYKFYCDKTLNDAHSAEADTSATIEVLCNQIIKYDLQKSLETLHQFCNKEKGFIDYERKFRRNENGEIIFTFGKYKGAKVVEQKDYLLWMLKQEFSKHTQLTIKDILTGKLTDMAINESSESKADKYFAEGKELIQNSNYEKAIVCYTQAIELKKDFGLAYLQRGFAKKFQKDFLSAIRDFDKAIELKETLVDGIFGNLNIEQAYWSRGQAKSALKDYYGAIRDYDKTIEYNHEFALAYSERAFAKIEIKDFQGAIIDCNKAIELDNNSQLAYFNRGTAKAHLMQHSSAILDFNKAIELDNRDIEAYCERAGLKSNMGDYHGALTDCNKAIEIDQSHHRSYLLRGITKFNLQDYDGAFHDLTRSAQLGSGQASQMLKEYYQQ